MRIAFVSYDFGEYCVRHANALARHGQVLLIVPRRLAAPYVGNLERAVTYRPFDRPRLRQPWHQLRTMKTMLRQIDEFAPDVVHFQRGHLWFNLALPFLRRYPLVVTLHDARHHVGDRGAQKTPQAIMALGYRQADRVIVHGEQVKEAAAEQVGLPKEKIHVVPHIAIGDDYTGGAGEGVEEENNLVLFFGRIWPYKGLEYLIRAEPRITASCPNARFMIAGEGEPFDRYQRMIVHPERFEVHNRKVSDEERCRLFQRASVVVLPYVEASQSGVIPVAYSFSKPVIATAVGALPDAVEQGRTGLLVPPRDADALADAVVQLLSHRELRRGMGAEGHKKLQRESAPAVVAGQTVSVYRSAMADGQRRRLSGPPHHAPEVPRDRLCTAATRLHDYIVDTHWAGGALLGPDPGIRFSARIGRFAKSYLRFLPWSDNMAYLQAQGYWILDNWQLAESVGRSQYRELALACSQYVLDAQRPDGYWDYPNWEWRGRIATVEGCFAALGLLESYARTGHEPFLTGAKKWREFLLRGIGFRGQADEGMLAVNYFAHHSGHGGGVPNNSTLALWFLARLAEVTRDDEYLQECPPMVRWLKHVQLNNGELPYSLAAESRGDRTHFLCYQYNAFELMDLVYYHRITGDESVRPMMGRLASYLSGGLNSAGAARYDCFHQKPDVTYYTTALARSLSQAVHDKLVEGEPTVSTAWARVLDQQREHGGFACYSQGNYGLLSDRRSYPRYLVMILNHLLKELQLRDAGRTTAGSCPVGTASELRDSQHGFRRETVS